MSDRDLFTLLDGQATCSARSVAPAHSGSWVYARTWVGRLAQHSTVLFPALRLGYLVAPPGLLPDVQAARRFVDTPQPILEQMALADFMAEGR